MHSEYQAVSQQDADREWRGWHEVALENEDRARRAEADRDRFRGMLIVVLIVLTIVSGILLTEVVK